MSDKQNQVQVRMNQIEHTLKQLKQSEGQVDTLKEELKEAKADVDRYFKMLRKLNEEIVEISNGQSFLPFNDDDIDYTSTPGLETVGQILAKARLENRKSLDSPLAVLVGYGVTPKQITSLQDGMSVSTVSELADAIDKNGDWWSDVPKVGRTTAQSIEEAVRKAMSERTPVSSEPTETEDDPRKRKCLDCGFFREQDEENCVCGKSEFELAEYEDESPQGDSEIDPNDVESVPIYGPEGKELATLHLASIGDDWVSCFDLTLASGETVGRKVPHHASQPFMSKQDAFEDAAMSAAYELEGLGWEAEAAIVKDWAMNRESVEQADPVEAA
ncbi:hypothetical protein KOR42_23890 [Thalassoglobus neptunius]|uniref:Uncharacterized protein n=1 Tax=Thalassoglobus neptunius TaxID=1938619 RepID=A0A5C5XAU5_9PLAN|nr:hypothetical protein [Thalassoglobus neptunius]TWT59002.1 hypothetical protein KOR42_23890 [Thalassoglobus neptunius]